MSNLVYLVRPAGAASSNESESEIKTAVRSTMDKLLSLMTMGEENSPFQPGNECVIVCYFSTWLVMIILHV